MVWTSRPVRRLSGTIRAPGRCDVYMGEGDDPGRLAGHTYQEGRLFYLFLKP